MLRQLRRVTIPLLLALTMFVCAVPASAAPIPPERLGLSSHTITLRTGATLHYVEKGQGQDHVMIFLHGYVDSWRSFELNLPLISGRYHVYALDQRGHGDSSHPACCYTQGDFAADVEAFMDALRIRRATLVGHSMGSLVAQQVAIDMPRRVEKLVLIASAPTAAGNEALNGLNEIVQTLQDPIDYNFVYEGQSSTYFNPVPQQFIETSVSESLKVPAAVWKSVMVGLLNANHSWQLGRVRAPTLILWGDRDSIFTYNDQIALTHDIPRSQLKIYAGTGHGLHVEWPQRFVNDLEAFVR